MADFEKSASALSWVSFLVRSEPAGHKLALLDDVDPVEVAVPVELETYGDQPAGRSPATSAAVFSWAAVRTRAAVVVGFDPDVPGVPLDVEDFDPQAPPVSANKTAKPMATNTHRALRPGSAA